MKKKIMDRIIIFILFTFILPIVKIPPQDIEGWTILNEKEPWVG